MIDNIYNEDCIITMSKMQEKSIHLVVTSPPYNIFNTGAKDRGYEFYGDDKTDEEYIEWTINIFNSFNRVLVNNGVVCYNMSYGTQNPHLMSLTIAEIIKQTNFMLVDIITWKKKTAMPNSPSKNRLTRICEYVFIFVRKDEVDTFETNKKVILDKGNVQFYESIDNFIEAKNNDETQDLNKATFSTKLVRSLFKIYAKPKSVVYDPFMGTGTTAVACIIDKHFYIGSEICPKQCLHAEKRIKPYINQGTFDF